MYANVNAPLTMGANMPPQPSYVSPAYGYGPCRNTDTFVLIVVLFILLIIVGAVCYY
ncbi:YjcZ family sporulation protein [Pontibacillus yanchengensis]|uniref:YjcZ family sporulation protein n=1 Tax=Pontibacillus yanchengensis TaxID=462910 RepID=UPI000B01A6F9